MKYRVVRATSGYYYVQEHRRWDWKKVGPFYRYYGDALDFAYKLKAGSIISRNNKVMTYI